MSTVVTKERVLSLLEDTKRRLASCTAHLQQIESDKDMSEEYKNHWRWFLGRSISNSKRIIKELEDDLLK